MQVYVDTHIAVVYYCYAYKKYIHIYACILRSCVHVYADTRIAAVVREALSAQSPHEVGLKVGLNPALGQPKARLRTA